jgi:hypothetical protein
MPRTRWTVDPVAVAALGAAIAAFDDAVADCGGVDTVTREGRAEGSDDVAGRAEEGEAAGGGGGGVPAARACRCRRASIRR